MKLMFPSLSVILKENDVPQTGLAPSLINEDDGTPMEHSDTLTTTTCKLMALDATVEDFGMVHGLSFTLPVAFGGVDMHVGGNNSIYGDLV